MSDTNQQSSQAVPQVPELKTGEGSGNAEVKDSVSTVAPTTPPAQDTSDARLEFVNKTTGRSYKTVEEAEKGLKETISYVGSLGQKASNFDKLVDKIAGEESISKEAAAKYVLDTLEGKKVEATNPNEVKTEVKTESRRPQDFETEVQNERIQKLEFLLKHPDAEAKIDVVRNLSKATGKDWVKTYEEDVLSLVNEGKKAAYATQESKTGQVLTTPNEPPVVNNYDKVFESFKTGRSSVMEVLKAKGLRIIPEE